MSIPAGNKVGQVEKKTQQRVVKLFRDALGYDHLGDWTDRIAKGELPHVKPQRPSGLERNVVVTMWDWADPKAYLHDVVSTDRRKPTVNAGGPVYGSLELSADYLPVFDPRTNIASRIRLVALFELFFRDSGIGHRLDVRHVSGLDRGALLELELLDLTSHV